MGNRVLQPYFFVLICMIPVTAKEERQIAPNPKNIRAGNRNFVFRSASSKRKMLISKQIINRTKGKNEIDSVFCFPDSLGPVHAAIGKERLQQTIPLPIRINPTKSVGCPYWRAN